MMFQLKSWIDYSIMKHFGAGKSSQPSFKVWFAFTTSKKFLNDVKSCKTKKEKIKIELASLIESKFESLSTLMNDDTFVLQPWSSRIRYPIKRLRVQSPFQWPFLTWNVFSRCLCKSWPKNILYLLTHTYKTCFLVGPWWWSSGHCWC